MGNKILYIGSLSKNSNSFARFSVLKKMGIDIEGIDIDPLLFGVNKWFVRLHHFLNWGPGICKLNRLVLKKTILFRPDIILVDNKPFINGRTIKKIRQFGKSKLINVVTDDSFGLNNDSWRLQKKTMSCYDFHFVQRSANVKEYLSFGAKKVLECDRSFNPEIHKPLVLTDVEKEKLSCQVGFIGTYAKHREMIISKLIEDGIKIAVWGSDWEGKQNWEIIKPFYRGVASYGVDYSKILNGMTIALHFLRKENRDDQDSRTFEIPACGVFMLAERTEKHLRYFKEGEEAEFFESYEELLKKINYYLLHEEQRKKIAEAGRIRSIKDDYSHEGRIKFILANVLN